MSNFSTSAGLHRPQHGWVCRFWFHCALLSAGGIRHQEHTAGQLHTEGKHLWLFHHKTGENTSHLLLTVYVFGIQVKCQLLLKFDLNKALTSDQFYLEIKFCISVGEESRSTRAPPRAQNQSPPGERAKKVTSRFVIKLLWNTVAKQNHTQFRLVGPSCQRQQFGLLRMCVVQRYEWKKSFSGNNGQCMPTLGTYFTTLDQSNCLWKTCWLKFKMFYLSFLFSCFLKVIIGMTLLSGDPCFKT